MNPEVIAALKGIADRMLCVTDPMHPDHHYDPDRCADCGDGEADHLMTTCREGRYHPFTAMEKPDCGTTSCDKMRLETIISALEQGDSIAWLRPFVGAA